MITVQHDHENQWYVFGGSERASRHMEANLVLFYRWEGRQVLLRKQEARIEEKKKLDEVLYHTITPFKLFKLYGN